VELGDSITTIPDGCFYECPFIVRVLGGSNVTLIKRYAFAYCRRLSILPFNWDDNNKTQVGDSAFFATSIIIIPKYDKYGEFNCAFPLEVHGTNHFWENVTINNTRENILTSKLSQLDPRWKTRYVLTDDFNTVYKDGCAILSVLHIYSALTGYHYETPKDFEKDMLDKGLSNIFSKEGWPGKFINVAPIFNKLGYNTDVKEAGKDISQEDC
jgi:hypothetical protein